MKIEHPPLPVAVLGAGPVGLAAAAHLVDRGCSPLVLEAGDTVARHLESYRHVRLFSPWRYNVDAAARRLLESRGWLMPAGEVLPTAGELVDRYLVPLASHPAIATGLRLGHRVTQVTRAGFDKMKSKGRDEAPFVVRAQTANGPVENLAGAVIDATGTWGKPNPLGANGIPAHGEEAFAPHISYGMPDVLGRERIRYEGKRVLVAGAGHSAAGTLIALAQLAGEAPQTRLVWVLRGTNLARVFGGGENDGLPARGELGRRLKSLMDSGALEVHAGFQAQSVSGDGGRLSITGSVEGSGTRTIAEIDAIIVSAGARPDPTLAAELRVKLDPWIESTEALAPLIDPNEHSCGTVRPHGHRELAHPEARFYAIGAKSYGRAPNFLLATGYEQARSVVAALAGDLAAADDVRLELPQTGVCSTQFDDASASCCAVAAPAAAASCCGGPAKSRADACCVRDEVAKGAGEAGCGCAATRASHTLSRHEREA